MFIEFEKWHGCKNDFIVVWASSSQFKNIGPSIIRKSVELCARNSGIGADGVMILVHPANEVIPEQLLIINSDGSVAKTCGNGIRCAALSVYQHALLKNKTPIESVELKVEGTHYFCQFLPQKGLPLVQVNMGIPALNEKNTWHKDALSFVKTKLKDLKLENLLTNVHTCSLANQHLVFFLDQEESISVMRQLGQLLQSSPHWDGINVSFASPLEIASKDLPLAMRTLEMTEAHKVFVWERGAGETPACGSAACAIASALLSSEMNPRSSWVPTLFPGGWLFAKQDSTEDEILLCGPGEFVFSGKIEI